MSIHFGSIFVKEDIICYSYLVVVAFIVGVVDRKVWPGIGNLPTWSTAVAAYFRKQTEITAWGLFASLDGPCRVTWWLVLRLPEEPHGLGCHCERDTASIEPVVHLLVWYR